MLSPYLILLSAFLLRVYQLDSQALWWDEGYSAFFAGKPLPEMLAATAADIHPPLYYGLLRGWSTVAGTGPWSMRFLSVAGGTLCVAAVYALGRRLISPRGGLIAAVLLALSPFQIHRAQEARMYPLLTLLVLLSTYLLARVPDKKDLSDASWSSWALYAALTVLTLLTHYYAVFIPPFQGLYVVLRRRGSVRRWTVATAAAVLLYAPWLARIAGQLPRAAADKAAAEGDPARGPLSFAGSYLSTVTVGYQVSGVGTALAAVAVVAATFLGLLALRRRTALPLLYLAVPLGGGLLLNQLFPFEAFPRLLAYAAPAVYLLVAAGLAGFWRWRRVGLAVTAVALVGLVLPYPQLYEQDRHPGGDYRPVVAAIDELARPNDLAILDFPWQAGYLHSYSRSQVDWWIAPGAAWSAEPAQMGRDLDRLAQRHPRLWYVAAEGLGSRRGQNIEGYLIRQAYLARDQWIGVNRLLLFGTGSAGDEQTSEATFGDRIRLTGAAFAERATPGEVLPVKLEWLAAGSVGRRLKVFVHLLDGSGQVAAQRDAEPVAGLRPTEAWEAGERVTDRLGVLIPALTSAGRYRVEVGWYDPDSGRRLTTAAGDDRVILGAVNIEATTRP